MQSHEQMTIPLSKLSLSPTNVRRSERADIKSLAHSIKNQGILHNLVVIPSGQGGKDRFEVVDGGRRLAALTLLREDGTIKASYGVPCQVVPDESAIAASLTANTERQDMSPADEFGAMKALIDGGKSIEDVAATFGVSPLVVKRRLKLANVAPRLIELYRQGTIDLEALMAFAATEDHARQLEVYDSLHKNNRHANWIRQALTKDELPSDDRLVRFITLKAYQKAGGPVRVDLFSDDKTAFVQDVALLHSLAQAKLDKKVQQAKDEEGAAWAEGRIDFDFSDRQAYGRVGTIRKDPSAKVAKQLAKLRGELTRLQEAEDDTDEGFERIDDLHEEIETIEQSLERPDPRTVKLAGLIVTIDHAGRIEIHRGLVRPEDKKALKALPKTDEAGVAADHTDTEDDSAAGLSGALKLNLSAQFTAGLQARLDASPAVAIRALAAALWVAASPNYLSRGNFPITVRGTRTVLRDHADGIEAGVACKALADSHAAWEARIGVDKNVFATLSAWSEADVIALLAHCTALNTDVTGQGAPAEDALAIAQAARLDMRDYWQPTVDSFLKRVPKSVILTALREVDTTLDLAPFEKAKKGELMGMAQPLLVAARWLPGPLRQKGV
jgi:ParB family chromosome partitioning protein